MLYLPQIGGREERGPSGDRSAHRRLWGLEQVTSLLRSTPSGWKGQGQLSTHGLWECFPGVYFIKDHQIVR